MERVVTINLNGNPYQLDESAYDSLRAYLARAEAALADNPDKGEVLRDLEQAVADKCASFLSAHKSVVAAAEMARILAEMGPVEGAEAGASAGADQPREAEPPRKRLYRLAEDAKIAGVCSGIGAYFNLDANLIRLVFILGFFFSGGALLLVYIAMMFLVPSAHTSEEWAAARGAPFNAQEVIDRAKREYAQFTSAEGPPWRWRREQKRAWKRAMREQADSWAFAWNWSDWGFAPSPPAQPIGYVTRVFAGLFAFVFSIITAALLIAFLVAFFSLLNTGAILGWTPPGDLPNWLAIVVLCIVYATISSPFSALRRSSYATLNGYRRHGGGGDALVMLAMFALAAWLAYTYVPEARVMMEHIADTVRTFVGQ